MQFNNWYILGIQHVVQQVVYTGYTGYTTRGTTSGIYWVYNTWYNKRYILSILGIQHVLQQVVYTGYTGYTTRGTTIQNVAHCSGILETHGTLGHMRLNTVSYRESVY